MNNEKKQEKFTKMAPLRLIAPTALPILIYFITEYDLNSSEVIVLLLLVPFAVGLTAIKTQEVFNYFLWSIWLLGAVLIFFNYGQIINDLSESELPFPFLLISLVIWGWGSARWLIKRAGFFSGKSIIDRIKIPSIKQFVLKNIVAPVIVSLIVWFITGGEPNITIISVPIIGVISLAVNVG